MNAGFTDEEVAALRHAHAQVVAYRQMGRPAPVVVALLDRLYEQWRKRVQRERAWQERRREVLAEALAEDARERRSGCAA